MHKLGSSLATSWMTFLQDIFEAVFLPSVDPPPPPGFLCRQPCQLSKLVNLLCRSIFFRPPLFLSSSSHLLLCYRGNQPDRKHGQSKKAPVGHDLQTRAVPRRREEAGHRAEHSKQPLYNSGRSAAPRLSADNGFREVDLTTVSLKRVLEDKARRPKKGLYIHPNNPHASSIDSCGEFPKSYGR